jgi:hypothetical protein
MTAVVSLCIVVQKPKALVRCVHAEVQPLGQIPGADLSSALPCNFFWEMGRTVIVPIIPSS